MFKNQFVHVDYNRFPNLDGIESKIIEHLVNSTSKYAENFWRLLKYNDLYALSQPALTKAEKKELICNDNGESTNKRVFLAPFTDDAWTEQCSSVYIYIEKIDSVDHMRSNVIVAVETVVHTKISVISGDYEPELNPQSNPNDADAQGNIVVPVKNRATVLLKNILAELNGLYLDGIGNLQFNKIDDTKSRAERQLWNSRAFFGDTIWFIMGISGVSEDSNYGY